LGPSISSTSPLVSEAILRTRVSLSSGREMWAATRKASADFSSSWSTKVHISAPRPSKGQSLARYSPVADERLAYWKTVP
jgi:hypothetical protein